MVLDRFYPQIGGAENQALLLARELTKNATTVYVVTSYTKECENYEKLTNIEIIRVRVFGWYILRQIYFMVAVALKIILLRKNFNIIHVHGGKHNACVSSFIGYLLKKKTIIKITNSGERFDLKMLQEWFFGLGKLFTKIIINYTDKFIALTPEIKKELINYGINKKKIIIIPNGVEIFPSIKFTHKDYKINKQKKIGICVASLSQKKNHKTLINSFKDVLKEFDCHLFLVGDGSLRDNLENQIRKNGLINNITISGWVKDVKGYFSIADFFVLPSWTEGLSNSVLEALSFGLPCIVSDIPGNRVLIQNMENGILINPKNSHDIAYSIIRIMQDNDLRNKLRINAKSTILKYSIESIAARYQSLYNSLLDEKRCYV